MKIIIEQKDVGRELDLDSMANVLLKDKKSSFIQLPPEKRMDPLDRIMNKIGNGEFKIFESLKKERKKPGPKPKIKDPDESEHIKAHKLALRRMNVNKNRKKPGPKKVKPQPLPESSDVNPLTGEPYVRRGFTIDTPVRVIPVENEEQFNKKLQSL